MRSFTHSLLEKARRYSAEPERMKIASLVLDMRGDNADHTLRLEGGRLTCDCDHYAHEGVCAHVVAAERVLGSMLPANAVRRPDLVEAI